MLKEVLFTSGGQFELGMLMDQLLESIQDLGTGTQVNTNKETGVTENVQSLEIAYVCKDTGQKIRG